MRTKRVAYEAGRVGVGRAASRLGAFAIAVAFTFALGSAGAGCAGSLAEPGAWDDPCEGAVCGDAGAMEDDHAHPPDELVLDVPVTVDEEPPPIGVDEPVDDEDGGVVDDGDAGVALVADAGAGVVAGAGGGGRLPTCSNVDARLLEDFGLVIRPGTLSFGGLASDTLGCAGRIKVYRMFVAPFEHSGYRRRLRPAEPVTIHLYRSADPRPGRCSGYVPNSRAIQVRDLRECLRAVGDTEDRNFRSIQIFLVHETGHVITARNSGLLQRFRDADLPSRDPRCYDGPFLKTYAYRSGVRPASESFAEAAGLFIGRRKVGAHARIDDFERECPHTHAWIRANLYD